MRGPITISIAQKKIDSEIAKKLTAKVKKENSKASKKNSSAPKRPSSGFFVFMEEFSKSYKEKFPKNKSVVVEKAPYLAKAAIRKAEHKIAIKAFNSKSIDCGADKPEESDKSSSEVHDAHEQEASS